jgi:hypothetical protein
MRDIYCCGCDNKKSRRLCYGDLIYPHRKDLHKLCFWVCDDCGNYVGCHRRTESPLGCIATPEIKRARQHIHRILDPIWQNKNISRNKLYKAISKEVGWKYHTAMIKSIEEARRVYLIVRRMASEITQD